MNNNMLIPASIIIAGAMIAGSVIMTKSTNGTLSDVYPQEENRGGEEIEVNVESLALSPDDHRKGSPDAPITVIEYSDLDCPFCTRFHATMEQVMENYEGKVSWVYRHFPLSAIHPNAQTKSLASECVATQLGESGFWLFIDTVFKDKTPVEELLELAEKLGADSDAFVSCMKGNNTEQARVEEQTKSALATGGQGTPWSLVVLPDGEVIPISGAQPYSVISQVIEAGL